MKRRILYGLFAVALLAALLPGLPQAQQVLASVTYFTLGTTVIMLGQAFTTIAGLTLTSPTLNSPTVGTSLTFTTVADSATAPTIASGGCTTGSAQSIATNGTAAFEVTLGGATCGSTITLTLPAATTHWHCTVDDITTPATSEVHQTAAASTTSVVLTNFVRTTGVAGNFTAADHLLGSCRAL